MAKNLTQKKYSATAYKPPCPHCTSKTPTADHPGNIPEQAERFFDHRDGGGAPKHKSCVGHCA